MKLDIGIHIVMHSVLFLKPGVTQKSWLHFIIGALQDCIHAKNMWGLTSKFTGHCVT